MTVRMTYSQVRANLANALDRVTHDHKVVVIRRRGKEDVAMISAAELASLMETVHLLRSPKNAQRLFAALNRAMREEELPVNRR